MRRAAVRVLIGSGVLLLSGSLVGCQQEDSQAECPAPQFTVAPDSITAGGEVELAGTSFFTACDDTGSNFDDTTDDDGGGRFEVTLEQGDVTLPLGEVESDDAGALTADLTIPDDVEPGPATISVATPDAGKVSVEVTVR